MMKSLSTLLRSLSKRSTRQPKHRRFRRAGRDRQGFSLAEIMIASFLFSVVMLVAWTGLMSALNMSQQAQAKTARKVELNTALDVLTDEVRQAQGVNRSPNLVVSNAVSMEQVVSDAGVKLSDLGNYGDIALYVELPTDSRINSCVVDDVSVPAEPLDKVVYDVRPSPAGWLSPNALVRYGRIPEVDGSITPCSEPIANDIIADAIAQTQENPSCDGTLTGSNGFHTCMAGDNVELLFKSSISDLNTIPISSAVTPRSFDFTPTETVTPIAAPDDDPVGQLDLHYSFNSGSSVDINWGWSDGQVPQELTDYGLIIYSGIADSGRKFALNKSQTSLFNFDINQVSNHPLDNICFRLTANVSDSIYVREKCASRNLLLNSVYPAIHMR